MADKKQGSNGMLNLIKNLNTATRATNAQTYGVSRDPAGLIHDNLDKYIENVRTDASTTDKQVLNSRMTRYKLGQSSKNVADLYDIIRDQDMMNTVQSLIGSENLRFAQTLKDYEIIKRCIPQVHKVITTLKNNIMSPDALANNSIGITYPVNIDSSDKAKIDELVGKYELNDKLQDWIMDYLIAGVSFVTAVPYSSIPDLLKDKGINEGIEYLKESINTMTLFDASTVSVAPITESISFDKFKTQDGMVTQDIETVNISASEINEAIDGTLKSIEFIKGGSDYFKTSIINEAINLSKHTDTEDLSMKTVLKKLKEVDKKVTTASNVSFFDNNVGSEGFVDSANAEKIRKKVDFKGCHIEVFKASKMVVFKMRETIVGYFYVEDKYEGVDGNRNSNLSTIMDKINASVYMRNDNSGNAARVETLITRTISEKLISAIDPRFLNDNMDDMNIIYEFVKDNALYNGRKRVVFFHPDDVCEFRRKEGSIMKNCMFFAKLYILTMLSNVITNVTRGADRQLYYVKTGLTTDIDQQVNSTIRAIKQNQIRYSDMGTINEIFNLVGSNVDLFMPVSVDGDRPIETETISGQNVDMNNDFLQTLIKSIIQSFGVPSSIIDDFENIEFSKTISMSNIDMAKATFDAQNEINPPLQKLFRLIVHYELPDFNKVDDIGTKLNCPSIIIFEMNRERVDSISSMADTLSGLLFGPDDELPSDKRIRLFKLAYFKENMPTLDWDAIENMVKKVKTDAELEAKMSKLNAPAEETGF